MALVTSDLGRAAADVVMIAELFSVLADAVRVSGLLKSKKVGNVKENVHVEDQFYIKG
jgi:hypothetical protein